MAKPIVWSIEARQDKQKILEYWFIRNGNKKYSRKFNLFLKVRLHTLSHYPQLGLKTTYPNIRFIVWRDYLVFYYEDPSRLIILRIWDGRRDPKEKPFQ